MLVVLSHKTGIVILTVCLHVHWYCLVFELPAVVHVLGPLCYYRNTHICEIIHIKTGLGDLQHLSSTLYILVADFTESQKLPSNKL